MTREEFINKAKQIHGEEYDYRSVPDTDLQPYNNIPIICERHGMFFQTVYNHLEGYGCFDCYKEKIKVE